MIPQAEFHKTKSTDTANDDSTSVRLLPRSPIVQVIDRFRHPDRHPRDTVQTYTQLWSAREAVTWGGESTMLRRRLGKKRLLAIIAVAAAGLLFAGAALASGDFGSDRDRRLANASDDLFGVGKPVAASSTQSIDAATANADPTKLITLAKGLKARVVTTTSGPNTDMMAF